MNSYFLNFDKNMQTVVRKRKIILKDSLITIMCSEIELASIEFIRNANTSALNLLFLRKWVK